MSGGGGTNTVTEKAGPPEYALPHLRRGANEAGRLYDQGGPQYFPGQTVVPFSGETEAALQLGTQRALSGSPVMDAGNQELASTLSGNYLYGGEGFNAALDAAERRIMPAVDSKFGASGRFGGGLHKEALGTGIADAFASQYGDERTNQMRAMMFAPSMAQQDYFDINQLSQIGGIRESLAQEQLQAEMDRYNYNQNLPQMNLQQYLQNVQGGIAGGTTTSNQPIHRNRAAGALGGAATGAMLASSLGGAAGGGAAGGAAAGSAGGPYGMAIGAALGGLLGYMA